MHFLIDFDNKLLVEKYIDFAARLILFALNGAHLTKEGLSRFHSIFQVLMNYHSHKVVSNHIFLLILTKNDQLRNTLSFRPD